MEFLLHLIQQYGLIIVFINVFLEQIGLPIPAYPTILIAAARTDLASFTPTALLFTSIIGAVIADYFWYITGRRYGRRVMSKLCRISLSPDSCVKQTEATYLKIGPSALLFCKFIPGFASISSALAGSLGTRTWVFIIMDGLGAAIWSGSAILLGITFSDTIDQFLLTLVEMGKWGGVLVGGGILAFIAYKWWKRHQFIKELRMARIDVHTLMDMLASDDQPVVIDTRPMQLVGDGWIPGARFVTTDQVDSIVSEIDPQKNIVLYCACPNELTAAKVAKAFISKGYVNVRPLTGGIDAWIAAGHEVEKS